MKSVIFEVPATQFNNAQQYELGPIDDLMNATTLGVWVVTQDTTGGSSPILTGWEVTGDRRLIININEQAVQPTDTIVIACVYQEQSQKQNQSNPNPPNPPTQKLML